MAGLEKGFVALRPTEEQKTTWEGAALRRGIPLAPFVIWAADYMARYTLEVHLQGIQRKEDPMLLRLDEKKLLRAVVDASWHALEFLPGPSDSPVSGAIRDPKGDLRKALEALHEHLDRIQEEYRK